MKMFSSGDRAGAHAAVRGVLKADPTNAQAHRLCAVILSAAGDHARALFHAEKAVALAPNAAAAHTTLGSVLDAGGEHDRALDAMRRAVTLNPSDAEAQTTLAITLDALDRFDEAAEHHAHALSAAAPGSSSEAHAGMNAALSMLTMGRSRDAVDLMQRLARTHPAQPIIAERLAFCMNYDDRATRADIDAAHRRWGRLIESSTTHTQRSLTPGDRLRVALVSPDLRAHSVANFVGPLLDHLDRNRFELLVYFTSKHADAVTEALRARLLNHRESAHDRWRDCPGLSDAELARTIAADHADIAIDLSGHFAGHRLAAFAQGVAPVQITWLGYPATTGLARIHARIVDTHTDPPSLDTNPASNQPDDTRAPERLCRLDPCFLCYDPPRTDLAEHTPAAEGKPFTFGSFNDLKKISPTTIDLWSKVLSAAPAARLFLKAAPLATAGVRTHLERAFADRGIDPSRLQLAGRSETRQEHLAAYRRVGLALDTFPYHGTTTTCEALWMGVPVLSRIGDETTAPHAARVGLSLLTNTGLADLCADDDDAFVAKAILYATDPAALAAVRAGLRERFLTSPVCDAPAFASRFGDLLIALAEERRP